MKENIRGFQKASFLLLCSIALAPLLGSVVLLIILGLLIYAIKDLYIKTPYDESDFDFKVIGFIFIGYFCCFTILEFSHSESSLSATRALGKIFPIFVIGLLSIFLKSKKFYIRYIDIGNAAVIGIYLTLLVAVIIKTQFPVLHINGYDFVSNSLDIHGRLTMLAGNALPFGSMFITLSFLTMLGISKKSNTQKFIAIIALILGTLTVALWNQSRGPMLSSLPLFLVTLSVIVFQLKLYRKLLFLLLLFLFIITALATLYILRENIIHFIYQSPSIETRGPTNAYEKYWYAYRTVIEGEPYDISVYTRLVMYYASIQTFFSSPMIGHGLDGMGSAVIPFLPSEWVDVKFRHFHNVYINHALAGGLLGLISLFLLLISPMIILCMNWRNRTLDSILCPLIIMISMITNGMTNVLFMHDLLGAFFVTLVLINGIANRHKAKP